MTFRIRAKNMAVNEDGKEVFMMSGVLKIAAKVGVVLAASFALGYAEYRIKGGQPIRKLYREVQAERLAAMAAAAKAEPIRADGTVK
jgi:hypothetical protein